MGGQRLAGDFVLINLSHILMKKARVSSASISRVCPGRVGADPGTHLYATRPIGTPPSCAHSSPSGYIGEPLLSRAARLPVGATSRPSPPSSSLPPP